MRFNVLDEYTAEKPPAEVPAETPEPERKMSFERIKGIIDRAGVEIANDKKLTINQKVDKWIELLKWALPLIPDNEQHFKAQIQESIKNPSEKDFISERTLNVETP